MKLEGKAQHPKLLAGRFRTQVRAGGGFWRSVGKCPGWYSPHSCVLGPLPGGTFSFLPLLVKFRGREGRQCSLQGLGEEMKREIAAVSSNPAGKAGRGLKRQLTCLH